MEQGFDFEHRRRPTSELVTLNFQEMELTELVHAIAKMTGRRFIIGPKLRAVKATVFSPRAVTRGEAYGAFLSVLASSGMTVEKAGRYHKIVESGSARTPICVEGEACPAGDRMITRLHRVAHVKAQDMTTLLERFQSTDASVTAYAPTNTMIITDYATNVRRMLRLIEELDVEDVGTSLWVHPVHHAVASELAEMIRELFDAESGEATKATPAKSRPRSTRRRGAKATPAASKATTIGDAPSGSGERLRFVIADDRTNQLIIGASEGTYLRIVALLRELDVSLGEADGEVRVHKLQNADAVEMAAALGNLASSSKNTKSGRRGRSKASKSTSSNAAQLFEGEVQISAHEATNSLIITGSSRDYISLKTVIDQLDVARHQVFVEAVIMEVSAGSERDLGVSFHGGREVDVETEDGSDSGLLYGGSSYTADGGLFSSILDANLLQGLALGIQGPELEVAGLSIPSFGVVLQALQTSSDVNVLSTPHILAVDNEPAEINVGQNVPVSTSYTSGLSSLTSLLGSSSDSSTSTGLTNGYFPNMSVGRQDVGIKMSITPHINQFDQVRLDLELEVSEITDESNDMAPIIGQRQMKTTCIMDDQQTVVIGGLVTDRSSEGAQKIPILGDIPILGKIFQRSTKRLEKRNLLVFITPFIIRDAADFRRIFARKMQERRDFIDQYTSFEYHEVQPEIDYERTNGLLQEINQAVAEVEEIEELRASLVAEEPPSHEPREPVGVATPRSDDEEGEESGLPAEEDAQSDAAEPLVVMLTEEDAMENAP